MASCDRGSADDIGNAGDNNLSTVIVFSTTMATAAMKVVLEMAATVALLKNSDCNAIGGLLPGQGLHWHLPGRAYICEKTYVSHLVFRRCCMRMMY